MSDLILRTEAAMGTVVTIQVVARDQGDAAQAAVERAVNWIRRVEACCSRFDPSSELRRLCARPGEAVEVSEMLFEAIRFALAVADATDGAFNPTIGGAMESAGFDENFRTGARGRAGDGSLIDHHAVHVDPERRTVTLDRPLLLDLGACAKGLAIDMAARDLREFRDFAVSAGGDLYAGGRNVHGEPWRIGIRHPRTANEIIETVELTDAAICTSGDYERRGADAASHHVLDPRTGRSANTLASVSVIAPTAMAADALATAAFVLGPTKGSAFLRRQGVEGVLYTPDLERFATACFRSSVAISR